jgi:hypothetical protein
LERTSKAIGIPIQTTTNDFHKSCVGTCECFEEKQIGNERFNFFTGCPKACFFIISRLLFNRPKLQQSYFVEELLNLLKRWKEVCMMP